MRPRKRLVLECGSRSLDLLGERDLPLLDRIQWMKDQASREEGIDLEILLYEGSSGLHRGVRPVSPPNEAMPELIERVNGAGIPFSFAMNGGLLHAEAVLPDEGEARVLEALEASGKRCGLRNKVVITRDALRPHLRRAHPGLELIASCIQQVSPRECGPYAAKLQAYDYVVPLNQHTTLDGLQEHRAQAGRLIVFLKLTCGMEDTRYCYSDYLSMEQVPWETIVPQLAAIPPGTLIPSALRPADSGCNHPGAALIRREHDLAGLIRMGVHTFKISRAEHLLPGEYQLLTRMIREHQGEGEG